MARWSTAGSITLFQGLIVRIPANNAYRSSPAPNFMQFSLIPLASANTKALHRSSHASVVKMV
ncbi:hypothetical protein HanIR_Chr14g0723761 [Helianthus annuus]|nr:hypothetical protein HanIR_Chr14g0723761 [Helianthus annuus]